MGNSGEGGCFEDLGVGEGAGDVGEGGGGQGAVAEPLAGVVYTWDDVETESARCRAMERGWWRSTASLR